jgi:hypothetical protein
MFYCFNAEISLTIPEIPTGHWTSLRMRLIRKNILKGSMMSVKKPNLLKKIEYPVSYENFLDEAEIIGIMLGDGHIMYNERSIRLRVRELDFCQNFSNLIEKTYKIKAPIDNKYYYNCYAHSTLLTNRISELTNHNKDIPKFILNGDNRIKARFLRGFFDSEGSMDVIYNRRQIVLTQNGERILLQIKSMLLDLGIQSKYVKKRFGSDKLMISLLENLEKYFNFIGFSIKYKQEKLKQAIAYLKKCRAYEKEKYWEVLRHWSISKKSLRGSAKEMDVTLETYRTWIYGMKMPCQIKADIKYGLVPVDYENLREQYDFLPLVSSI